MEKLELDIQRFAADPPTAGNLIDEECLYEYHQNIETYYAKKTDIPTETVLYNNDSGTTGDITLSDDASNYSYMEIYYHSDSRYYCEKVYSPNGKDLTLMTQTLNASTPALYGKTKGIHISGTTISVSDYSQYCLGASSYNYLRVTSSYNLIYITRVVGYK